MKRLLLAAGCLALVGVVAAAEWSTASDSGPVYTSDGKLKFPESYREWVFLSSGLDMSYSDRGPGHSMFDNVFVEPSAYREFMRTGTSGRHGGGAGGARCRREGLDQPARQVPD